MLSSIVVPSGSGTYTFPNANVILQNVQGLGVPDPKRGYHEYSNISGGINLSQFHTTRRVSFDGYLATPDVATLESVRQALQTAFVFNNAEKNIQMTTQGGLQVQGNAMIAAGFQFTPEMGVPTGGAWHVELDFADPILYSQTGHSIQGGVATNTGGIILPATLPFTLAGTLVGALTLTNNGNVAVFPDTNGVTLTGPGSSFTISNKTTGNDLFYNASLSTGDSVVFDFVRKTAIKNGTTNVYGNVSGTWWQLNPGANTVILTCGGSNTSDTLVKISWHDAYINL